MMGFGKSITPFQNGTIFVSMHIYIYVSMLVFGGIFSKSTGWPIVFFHQQ